MDTEFKNVSRELLIKIDSIRNIMDISSNCYKILGYKNSELIGSNINDYIVKGNIEFTLEKEKNFELSIKSKNGTADYSKPIQTRMRDKTGKYVWFEDNLYPVYNSEGKLIAIEGFCRNIQDRKELEEQLEELSCYVSLTRLFSSNYYKKQEKRLNEVKNSSIGIIMCDLDNLKITNDSFGHAYGDRLLINFGNILKRKFIKNAVIARLGGDEFIVLFENTSEGNVKKSCLELQQTVEEFNICNQNMPIQVSIGWAYSPTSLYAMKNIFNIADDMMYEYKLNKRKNIIN